MNKHGLIALIILLVSCSPAQRPIQYGTDECAYCKMIIMDHRYGAELVSSKGKIAVFDAAECMVDYLNNNEESAGSAVMLLVTPYTDPDQLFDAREASYLVSGKMPSPMGAYLNSFRDRQTAMEFQASKGGSIYTWDELYKDLQSIRLKAIEEFE